MLRRHFLATALAAPLLALSSPAARAAEMIPYEPGVLARHLEAGDTVLLDYFAPWCPTCLSQSATLDRLRAANPAYDQAITFMRVDWDTYKRDPVTTDRRVPRRSTLLLLKGEDELARVVAQTREADLRALLDMGVEAGGS